MGTTEATGGGWRRDTSCESCQGSDRSGRVCICYVLDCLITFIFALLTHSHTPHLLVIDLSLSDTECDNDTDDDWTDDVLCDEDESQMPSPLPSPPPSPSTLPLPYQQTTTEQVMHSL